MVMREQVLHGFEEQRVLVDALTNVSVLLSVYRHDLFYRILCYERQGVVEVLVPHTLHCMYLFSLCVFRTFYIHKSKTWPCNMSYWNTRKPLMNNFNI